MNVNDSKMKIIIEMLMLGVYVDNRSAAVAAADQSRRDWTLTLSLTSCQNYFFYPAKYLSVRTAMSTGILILKIFCLSSYSTIASIIRAKMRHQPAAALHIVSLCLIQNLCNH